MKKVVIFVILLSVVVLSNFYGRQIINATPSPELQMNSTAAVLMEPISKNVIFAKNEHQRLAPASMTKMMGMYIVLEEITSNRITFDQIVTVSLAASQMGGSQVFLQQNEQMSVRDLFKSVAISSANDAMYALAETVSGSEQEFVKRMNEYTKKFGMKNTHFENTSGFDSLEHYSTAYDMALLGRELLTFDRLILQYSSLYQSYIREKSASPFWLVNTNKLVRFYEGMDGLKTGFTQKAGYCLTGSAKRNNTRFLAVSMNAKKSEERNSDITRMLDYGFNNYKTITLYKKDQVIGKKSFLNSKEKEYNITLKEDVVVVIKKSESKDNVSVETSFTINQAPVVKDSVVGQLVAKNKDGIEYRYDLIVQEDVELLKYHDIFFYYLLKFIN